MKRPTKHKLALGTSTLLLCLLAFWAPSWLMNLMAALGILLVGLSLYVGRNFFSGRSLLRAKQYELATHRLIDFEKELLASPWKQKMAWLFTGIHTSSGLALARSTLGAVRLEEGQIDECEVHFRKAIEHDAGYAFPYANLALVAQKKSQFDQMKINRDTAVALGLKASMVDVLLNPR